MSHPFANSFDVDGFILNGVDEFGAHWRALPPKGWYSGSGVDGPRVQHVASHGEFPQQAHRTGRPIVIVGKVEAASPAVVGAAIERLNALLADGQFGIFTHVHPALGRRWARVQLADPNDSDWNGSNVALFTLSLWSPSPYKFGDLSSSTVGFFTGAQDGTGMEWDAFPDGDADFDTEPDATSGVAVIRNDGTADAPVEFRVAGPTPVEGFRITSLDSGERGMYVGGAIPEGSVLSLNGSNGRVLIDGVADRSAKWLMTRWPIVPAGRSASFLFESLGALTAAEFTARCHATYW